MYVHLYKMIKSLPVLHNKLTRNYVDSEVVYYCSRRIVEEFNCNIMDVSTFQLLRMVAPIILFTLILGSVDVWTDANLIGNLFIGEAECLERANVKLCYQVGVDVFCNSSEYSSSIFDHSICPFGGGPSYAYGPYGHFSRLFL